MTFTTNLLIAGELRAGGGDARDILNPATGAVLTSVPDASIDDLDAAIDAASRAWPAWDHHAPVVRAGILRKVAAAIEAEAERLADILVAEVGKPISEARGEINAASGYFAYAATLAETLTDETRYTAQRGEEIWTKRRPHGVVGAIIPWNYPSALVSRKVAPALAAGNAVVLKADEKTPLSALALGDLLHRTGLLPAGLVNIVTGSGESIGARLTTHPAVDFLTMTGSGNAGKAILRAASSRVTPVSLELGGNAPFIVLPTADLDAAVRDAVFSRHMNNGQVCIATERIYVHESVEEQFVRKYVEQVGRIRPADPRRESTIVGPKVSAEERERTEQSLEASVKAGARLLVGGDRPTGDEYGAGFWLNPAVLVDVDEATPAVREELFGPVTPIARFDDWNDVVANANASDYGLSAYVYTARLDEAYRASDDLRYGEVYVNRVGAEEVNGFHAGFRQSGLGGDDGPHGFDQYFLRQTTYLRHDLTGGE